MERKTARIRIRQWPGGLAQQTRQRIAEARAQMTLIGYFAAVAGQTGLSTWTFLLGFVIPHGVMEIPAIILAAALIIRLGLTMVTPNEKYTIGEAWIRSLADWTRIILLVVVPLLFVAAFLEVYITPQVALFLFSR